MGNKAHFREITGLNKLVLKKAWCYRADKFNMFNMDGLTDRGCYFNIFNNGHDHDFAVDFNSDILYDPMQYGPTTQAEASFVPPTFALTDDVWGSYTDMGCFFVENEGGYLIVFGTMGPPSSAAVVSLHSYGFCKSFISIERGPDNKKQRLVSPTFRAPGVSSGFYVVSDDANNSVKLGTFRQPVQNSSNPSYPENNQIFKEDAIFIDTDGNVGGMLENFKIFSVNTSVIPNNYYPDGRCMRTTDADGNTQLWFYIGFRCWVPIDSLDFGIIDGDNYLESHGSYGERITEVVR